MVDNCETCIPVQPRHRRELALSVVAVPLSVAPIVTLLLLLEDGSMGLLAQIFVAALLVASALLALFGMGVLGGLIAAWYRHRQGHNAACLVKTVRVGATFPFFILKEILT